MANPRARPILMSRADHCCCCGEPRKPTQAPVSSFGNDLEIVTVGKFRELKPGRWEDSPQLLVGVHIYRNGGTATGQTHICDSCIVLGLQHAKNFVERSLAALGACMGHTEAGGGPPR